MNSHATPYGIQKCNTLLTVAAALQETQAEESGKDGHPPADEAEAAEHDTGGPWEVGSALYNDETQV